MPIDSSGVLPGGIKFEGPAELRQILLGERDEFAATVTEKLLTYALGRGVEYYDEPAVREILREAAPNDYRWSFAGLGHRQEQAISDEEVAGIGRGDAGDERGSPLIKIDRTCIDGRSQEP